MNDPFGDLGDALNMLRDAVGKAKKKPAAAPQLRGRYLDGDYYVRADDLAALLDSKGLMPNLANGLKGKAG